MAEESDAKPRVTQPSAVHRKRRAELAAEKGLRPFDPGFPGPGRTPGVRPKFDNQVREIIYEVARKLGGGDAIKGLFKWVGKAPENESDFWKFMFIKLMITGQLSAMMKETSSGGDSVTYKIVCNVPLPGMIEEKQTGESERIIDVETVDVAAKELEQSGDEIEEEEDFWME